MIYIIMQGENNTEEIKWKTKILVIHTRQFHNQLPLVWHMNHALIMIINYDDHLY